MSHKTPKMLGAAVLRLKSKFNYATLENIQLERAKDMIDHGNFKYALELIQTIKPRKFHKEFDIIKLKIKQHI